VRRSKTSIEVSDLRILAELLICIVCLVSGQVLWKHGLTQIGGFSLAVNSVGPGLLRLMRSPFIIAGVILYALSVLVYFDILSESEMSYVWPLLSASYIVGMFAARFLLHEPVSPVRWLGVVIICIGVALILRS